MKKRSLDLIIAIMLVFVTLLAGGLSEAYLAPDYSYYTNSTTPAPFVIGPGVLPDYLTAPNWAFSPPLTKFVDPLPGLCVPTPANSLCASTGMTKNIPVALPDIVTYPGSDYYVIELRQYTEKMHTDLANPTTLRGYVQANKGTDTVTRSCTDPSKGLANPCVLGDNTLDPAVQHFLGPVIVATKGRPVRVLFRNKIDPAVDGNLFLPIDDTIMGAGAYDVNYDPITKTMNAGWDSLDPAVADAAIVRGMFSTNRATLHLHGGRSPWISDGTPHQWITPAVAGGGFEDPIYPQGISVENVPDMPAPAVGEQTFYWTNQQSSRMMFYHDHAWGITRLNVYAGEAAGYLIRDDVEKHLTDDEIIPGTKSNGTTSMGGEIPLVIMDKTFVDASTINATDPTWNWGTGAVAPGNNGVITWITVTEGGSGYNPATPPTVTIDEGGNISASATAVVSSVIASIALDIPYVNPANPGSGGLGYVAPLVLIDDPTGSGASAEATIDANGTITGFTITSGGWGYSAPVVTIADQNNDTYTAASASATVAATVSAVAITNGGTGYTNPTVSIAAPGAGVQATAVATVTDIRDLKTGDLWWPHVYMPAQNPFDVSGVAPLGRWAYGPYFYPATNNLYQPIPNPYFSPDCNPAGPVATTPGLMEVMPGMPFCQAPEIPSTPNPSWGAEAFMDTMLVNGTAYPTVTLEPKSYRLRILNAAHDRFVNLALYLAADKNSNTIAGTTGAVICDGGVGSPSVANCTEIAMINAAAPLPGGYPSTWPVDGRAGGVPRWEDRGPDWIMIGNEGGFLPMPVVIPPHPLTWNANPSMFNVGNINGGSLILGPAERADVIVDFSAYEGKTLILSNDGSAPWPALNPQYDFYTGNPDGTASGSAPSTAAGFGPNTHTVMQVHICKPGVDPNCANGGTFTMAKLQDAFDPTVDTNALGANYTLGVFQQAQDPIVAAQGDMNPTGDPAIYEAFLGNELAPQGYDAYTRAYGTLASGPALFPTTYPNWGISRINDSIIKIRSLTDSLGTMGAAQSIAMKRKSIHDEMGATFDDYGRMRAALGLEKGNPNGLQVNFIVQTYSSPVTEDFVPEGIQVWKISHNGVDTHPIHFHLFDVQILNRVGWDGFIRMPDPTEMGWKETVRISPLEDTIIAVRAKQPALPFGLPESNRPLNPATPIGSTTELTQIDPVTGNPRVTTNVFDNFAWEYVWHCHILSHEENDMMRAIKFHVVETVPEAPVLGAAVEAGPQVRLTWTDPAANAEIGFRIERCTGTICSDFAQIASALANATTYLDTTVASGTDYVYRVTVYNATYTTASNAVGISATNAGNPAYMYVPATSANGTIALGWGASATAGVTYVVEESTDIGFTTLTPASPVYNGPDRAATLTGRLNGNTYYYRVKATKAGLIDSSFVNGPNGCVVTITAGVPAYMTVPAASSNGSISLAWGASATAGVTYVVEEFTDAGFTIPAGPNPVYSGLNRNVTLTGRTSGTYYYRVKATMAGMNDSAWRNGANGCVVTLAPVATPSYMYVPAGSTNGTIGLGWGASATAGVTYVVEEFTDAAFTIPAGPNPVYSGLNRSVTLTGRLNGSYYYRVKATLAGRPDSGYSNGPNPCVVNVTVATPSYMYVPAAPTAGNIGLGWGTSATAGVTYVVEEFTDAGFTIPAGPNPVYSGLNRSVTLTGRTTGSYYYRVKATKAGNNDSAYRNGPNPCVVP